MTSLIVVIASLYLALALAILARRKPGYSHIQHTISELGEVGAPDQHLVAWGIFLPVGLCVAMAGVLLLPHSRAAAALAFCIAVGYVVGAMFPCDPGPPGVGSTRQGIHNLAAGAEYLGGGAALMAMEGPYGNYFKIAGFVPWALAFMLLLAPASPVRGVMQRITEIALFGGLAVAAYLEPIS